MSCSSVRILRGALRLTAVRLLAYLLFAVYLCWYVAFERPEVPLKVDTAPHLWRVHNLVSNFAEPWQPGPYFGYPEHYHSALPYLLGAALASILSVSTGYKAAFVVLYFAMGVCTERAARAFFASRTFGFACALVYMSMPSFVFFGLGSGSLPRVAEYTLFPLAFSLVVDFCRRPGTRSAVAAAMGTALLYHCHPVAMVNLAIALPAALVVHGRALVRWRGVRCAALGILCMLGLVLWQLGPWTGSRDAVSFTQLGHVDTSVSFRVASFLGPLRGELDPRNHERLGNFPMLALYGCAIYLGVSFFIGHRAPTPAARRRFLALFLLCGMLAIVAVLAGPRLRAFELYRTFVQFPFRHTVPLCLSISFLAGFLLWRMRSVWAFVPLLAIACWDDARGIREYGGRDYLWVREAALSRPLVDATASDSRVEIAARTHSNATYPGMWARLDYLAAAPPTLPFDLHGFFEYSPHNLGYLAGRDDWPRRDELHAWLGSRATHVVEDEQLVRRLRPEYRGDVHRYARWLVVEAPDKESALGYAYDPLLSDPTYRPSEMPLVFVRTPGERVTVRAPWIGLSLVVAGRGAVPKPDWVPRVAALTSDAVRTWHGGTLRRRGETLEFELPAAAGELVVVSEAYHPRRQVLLGEDRVAIFPVEPGLIGFRAPITGELHGAVSARFLPSEMAWFGVSLLAWLAAIVILFRPPSHPATRA